MSGDGKKSNTEREQTDESLRVERQDTDRTLHERQAIVERDADSLIRRERENADALLAESREKADERRGLTPSSAPTRVEVAEERANEDHALHHERDRADETLRRERAENARTLATLLPLEREKTDRFLLTERARSDDALLQRDDFLGIVSHDLRNLLSGIVMSATLLSTWDSGNDDESRVTAEALRIRRYAARMNRLVGDLVDVASMDAGKLAVTRARGDSRALVAEAAEMFRAAASAKDISIRTGFDAPPLPADFDYDRMLQVLANLVTNAIKFTPRGGSVSVDCERVGDEIRFSVGDTGPGIPEGMTEAVFERFWQAGKNDRRGVGLGLYISRCIVEAHGGRIWAESTPGEGSTFYVTLPI